MAEWRKMIQNPKLKKSESDDDAMMRISMYDFLKLPKNVSEDDLRKAYLDFAYGIEGASKNNALLAFHCQKRANTRQGEIRRYLGDILMTTKRREYGYDNEIYITTVPSIGIGYNTPHTLTEASICIVPDRVVKSDIEDKKIYPAFIDSTRELLINTYAKTLYIHTDDKINYGDAKYYIKASNLEDVRLINDIIDVEYKIESNLDSKYLKNVNNVIPLLYFANL